MMGKKTPALHLKDNMETNYVCIFPETFKTMNNFLAHPIGTASVD